MKKRVRRWRLSDVVRAMSLAAGDSHPIWISELAAEWAAYCGVRRTLRLWSVLFPRLLRVPEDAWVSMTDAKREALVVAEARRLKVPRRA